jgi:hypothetical protein
MRRDQGGMGGTAEAAGAGGEAGAAGKVSLPQGSGWFCLQIGSACSCNLEDGPPIGNFCPQPLPTCCLTLLDDDKPNCQCWPKDSPECHVGKDEAFVEKCPP